MNGINSSWKKKLKFLLSILKDSNIFSHQVNNLKLFDIALYPNQNGYLQGNKQKILMNIYMDKEPFFIVAGNVNW